MGDYETTQALAMGGDLDPEDCALLSLDADGLQRMLNVPNGDSSDYEVMDDDEEGDEEDEEEESGLKDQSDDEDDSDEEDYGDRGNWHNEDSDEDFSEDKDSEYEGSEYEGSEDISSEQALGSLDNEIEQAQPSQKKETWRADIDEAHEENDLPDGFYEEFDEDGKVTIKEYVTAPTDDDNATAPTAYLTLDEEGKLVRKNGTAKSMGLSETELDKKRNSVGLGYSNRIQNIRLKHYRNTHVKNSTRDEEIPPNEVVHASATLTLDLGASCRYAVVVGKPGEFSEDEEENLKKINAEIGGFWYENTNKGRSTYYPEGDVYLNKVTGEYEIMVRVKHPKKKKEQNKKEQNKKEQNKKEQNKSS